MVILAAVVILAAAGIFWARQTVRLVPAELPAATLDLNRAAASDLETIPGIGVTLAERIVAYRESCGPFSSVEDVTDVPGVGAGKLAQMEPYVTVTP